MKPLAKLTLLRQRLYAKDCAEDTASSGGGNTASGGGGSSKHLISLLRAQSRSLVSLIFPAARRANCDYGEWGPWRQCNPKCGDGTQYRQRYLKNADAMNKQCNEVLYDTRDCHTDCEEEQATGNALSLTHRISFLICVFFSFEKSQVRIPTNSAR